MMKSLMSQYRFILLLLIFPVPGTASAGNPLDPPLFSMQTDVLQPAVVFCIVAGPLLAAVSVYITCFLVRLQTQLETVWKSCVRLGMDEHGAWSGLEKEATEVPQVKEEELRDAINYLTQLLEENNPDAENRYGRIMEIFK